jgi:general secretion pathway protein H
MTTLREFGHRLDQRPPTPQPERGQRATGFTLLEIMLVLTIIGMASILVVPNLGGLESRSFRAQVQQANSLLNYTRRSAVVSGQPSTASFFIGSGNDNEENAPRTGAASRSSVGRWDSFGTTVRYRDSTDREMDVEAGVDITFYPEGGSTGGTLLLSQDDLNVSIEVNPFTGRLTTAYLDANGDVIE